MRSASFRSNLRALLWMRKAAASSLPAVLVALTGCGTEPKTRTEIPAKAPVSVQYAGPEMDPAALSRSEQAYERQGMAPDEATEQAQYDYLKTHHGDDQPQGPALFGPGTGTTIDPVVPTPSHSSDSP